MGVAGWIFVGVVTVLVAAAGLQIAIGLRAKAITGKPLPADLPEPLRTTLGTGLHLVYVWSPTCGPCKVMAPTVDALVREGAPVIKLDASRDPETCMKLGVMGTPTTLVVRDGVVADVMMGMRREADLRSALG
ncbi:MAG: thioredoxin family protein [Myxococcota bacterium]